tara:strand:+ start:1437 stop:1988 length:552 start_codon:yes stop_codon:yes gene_type:complete
MFFKYRYIPNYLSLLRIFLTPIFIFAMFQNTLFYKLISLKIFFLASLSDFFDGYIARKYNFVSNFGKNIDPISDKILVISSFIVLSILYPSIVTCWMVCLIISRDILVTLLRYYKLNTSVPLQTNFIAKRKTLIQIIIIHLILILHILEPSYIINNQYLYYMILSSIILSWLSAFTYILPAKK